jgi:hypothetical protein
MASSALLSPEDARELFLWKWKDVSRPQVNSLLIEFRKYDYSKSGELEENEALMLLEARGDTKTVIEMRETFARIDINHNHKLSFLEWLCYIFDKDFTETNTFQDNEARAAAMDQARRAGDHARQLEEAEQKRKAEEEEEARRRAEELERESQLVCLLLLTCCSISIDWSGWNVCLFQKTNCKCRRCHTNKRAEGWFSILPSLSTLQIKDEAARRKALREAKKKEQEAIDAAAKVKSEEEVMAELAYTRARAESAEGHAAAAAIAEEKARRAAKKADLNAKWGGSGPK